MTESVAILATCINQDVSESATWVLETVRVGFPTASVTVFGNGLPLKLETEVKAMCRDANCTYLPLASRTTHDRWISKIVDLAQGPVWVVDTDVVFWASMEQWTWDALMAGRFEPGFVEPWTHTHRVPRLHTCVLRLDPPKLRPAMKEWISRWHPKGFPFLPQVEFVCQHYVPQGTAEPPMFYDTCTGMYQALGGQSFTDEQNAAFDHLHCGVYADEVTNGALSGLMDVHRAAYRDRETARGLYRQQQEFYSRYAILT